MIRAEGKPPIIVALLRGPGKQRRAVLGLGFGVEIHRIERDDRTGYYVTHIYKWTHIPEPHADAPEFEIGVGDYSHSELDGKRCRCNGYALPKRKRRKKHERKR